MFKGFNLKLKELFPYNQYWGQDVFGNSYTKGSQIHEGNKEIIRKRLENYLRNDNKLDGTSIKEQWFPQIKADIFISHSHKDEKQAIALSGWLNENFGLNAFIDSLVWDYAPNLIDEFNNTYNVIANNPPNRTYGYETAKYISSHVDLMLSTALNSMIDHCEALFFLNTPFSSGEIIQNGKLEIKNIETESPWIYSELEISKIVREKIRRKRFRCLIKSFSAGGVIGMESLNESTLPPIIYDTDISHLFRLTKDDLEEWKRLYSGRRNRLEEKQHPLDTLYDFMKVEGKPIE